MRRRSRTKCGARAVEDVAHVESEDFVHSERCRQGQRDDHVVPISIAAAAGEVKEQPLLPLSQRARRLGDRGSVGRHARPHMASM